MPLLSIPHDWTREELIARLLALDHAPPTMPTPPPATPRRPKPDNTSSTPKSHHFDDYLVPGVVQWRDVIVIGKGSRKGEGAVQGEENVGDRDEFVGFLGLRNNGPGEMQGDDGEGGGAG
jgi:hypothetical protein